MSVRRRGRITHGLRGRDTMLLGGGDILPVKGRGGMVVVKRLTERVQFRKNKDDRVRPARVAGTVRTVHRGKCRMACVRKCRGRGRRLKRGRLRSAVRGLGRRCEGGSYIVLCFVNLARSCRKRKCSEGGLGVPRGRRGLLTRVTRAIKGSGVTTVDFNNTPVSFDFRGGMKTVLRVCLKKRTMKRSITSLVDKRIGPSNGLTRAVPFSRGSAPT